MTATTPKVSREEARQARLAAMSDDQIRDMMRASGNTDPALQAEINRRGLGAPQAVGPVPKVTGYAKGREVRPGMLINAADLLPMHESQGNTTGENPNPRGHQAWIRVGLVGNTNNPAYQSYNSNRSLTGGMYVVFDQSGHPAGRMSANTIAEINDEDVKPEAELQHLRTPVKVRVKVKNPITREETIEERDGFDIALVPSRHAQQEAGMPAPRMLADGIVHPDDPHYGPRGQKPQPTNRPFGEFVTGTRTREQTAADRKKRAEVYAAGEPERAARRAEEEARRREEAKAEREQQQVEAKKKQDERLEQYRRNDITRSHEEMVRSIAEGNEQRVRDNFRHRSDRGVRLTAEEYGVKTRGKGVTRESMIDGIVEAVRTGKQPDYEIHAPKPEPVGDEAAALEAKKIAASDKRRRTKITQHFESLLADVRRGVGTQNPTGRGGTDFTMHVRLFMSDNERQQLAEAFHLEQLQGQAFMDALYEAIQAGQTPDLDAAPITSLKKKR